MVDALAVSSVPLRHLASYHDYHGSLLWRERPLALPLLMYYDGTGRRPAFTNVTWIDVERAQPWSTAFIEWAWGSTSPLQQIYRAANESRRIPCVVWGRVTGTEASRCQGSSPPPQCQRCQDVFTVFKVAALYDAARNHPASRLLWLDLDTWFQRPLDVRFWSWCDRFDVATISRKMYWPDTGITYYAPSSSRLELLEAARSAYSLVPSRDGVLTAMAGGFNDVQIFGHLLARRPSVRVGHFAVGCRPARSEARWLSESRPYKVKPRQHYCPSETADVSPFNLFEYITHKKHRSGPMADVQPIERHRAGGGGRRSSKQHGRPAGAVVIRAASRINRARAAAGGRDREGGRGRWT